MPYRMTAAVLGLVTVALSVLGLTAGHRYMYVVSVLTAIAASAAVILMRLEAVVERVVERQFRASRGVFAIEVAEALADELEERRNFPHPPSREPAPRLSSVR